MTDTRATAELTTLRCHWIKATDAPEGCDPWVLIPGCSTAAMNPEAGCDCDTLERRLAIAMEQRRDCDRVITKLRHRCQVWSRAGAAAWEVLTGRADGSGGFIHPEELARAARAARTRAGDA